MGGRGRGWGGMATVVTAVTGATAVTMEPVEHQQLSGEPVTLATNKSTSRNCALQGNATITEPTGTAWGIAHQLLRRLTPKH